MSSIVSLGTFILCAQKTQRFGYRSVRVVLKGDGVNRLVRSLHLIWVLSLTRVSRVAATEGTEQHSRLDACVRSGRNAISACLCVLAGGAEGSGGGGRAHRVADGPLGRRARARTPAQKTPLSLSLHYPTTVHCISVCSWVRSWVALRALWTRARTRRLLDRARSQLLAHGLCSLSTPLLSLLLIWTSLTSIMLVNTGTFTEYFLSNIELSNTEYFWIFRLSSIFALRKPLLDTHIC